jgi:ATP synthase protein I
MSDHDGPDPLKGLDAKLKKARETSRHGRPDEPQSENANPKAFALGMRVALEMIAAFIGGGVIGWFLDQWLGTSPWMLILWVALGFAAGIRSALRVTQMAERAAKDDRTGDTSSPNGTKE